MLFSSPAYIFVFLPLVVMGYFLLNDLRLVTAAKIWLVGASLFFYAFWNISYLPLLLLSIGVNYGFGIALHRVKLGPTAHWSEQLRRKLLLALGVSFNLGLLAWFKYADFLIENYNTALDAELIPLNLALPLAISFFTFQQIAYLADSYRQDTKEYDFLSYCLFVTFFPQLIAGPIVHHSEMMPQFRRLREKFVDWNNIAAGLFIFTIGLFKKLVIADGFAQWANAGYATTEALGLFEAWGTSLSYSFQLYYDFSGYTDMAIGAALLFNIRLPINFNSPYKAIGIRQFWRRWHMTLTRWLRDYVYIPLGGNRGGSTRTSVNIVATFLLGGLWHGAAWTFVAWGLLHGIAITLQRLWQRLPIKLPGPVAWLITFLFINASWVLFRADSYDQALMVYSGMLGLNGAAAIPPITQWWAFVPEWPYAIPNAVMDTGPVPLLAIVYLSVFGVLAFIAPNSAQMLGWLEYRGRLLFRPTLWWALLLALLFFLSILQFAGDVQPTEFLYFNF